MKTMNSLLCMLLLAVCVSAGAQQFKATLSDESKFRITPEIRPVKDGFIELQQLVEGKKKPGGFKLERERYGIKLVKYNNEMKEQGARTLSGGELSYGPFSPTLRVLNNKLCLFYYRINGSGDASTMSLLVAEVDSAANTGEPVEVLTVDAKNVAKFSYDMYDVYGLLVQKSPGNTKMAVALCSGMSDDIFISVLDKDLHVIRQHTETAAASTARVVLHSMAVDDAGNVYLAYKRWKDAWLVVNDVNDKTSDKAITLTEGPASQVHLVASPKANAVAVTGPYGDGYLKGVFVEWVKFGTDMQENLQQLPFPDTLVHRFKRDGWASEKKKNYGLADLYTQSALLDDGTISIAGEFRTYDWTDHGKVVTSGDVLVIQLKNGKASFARIPKSRQSMNTTLGDSYYFFPYKDKTIIFYSDGENNLRLSMEDIPSKPGIGTKMGLVAAVVSNTGEVTRQLVGETINDRRMVIAEMAKLASPTRLMVPIQHIRLIGNVPTDDFRWMTVDIMP